MSAMRLRREKPVKPLKDLKRREVLNMGIEAATRAKLALQQNLDTQRALLQDMKETEYNDDL